MHPLVGGHCCLLAVLLLVVIVVLVEAVILRGLGRRGRLVMVLLGVVRVLRVVLGGRSGGGWGVILMVVMVRAASRAAPGVGVVEICVAEAVVGSDDIALVAHRLRKPVVVVVRGLLVGGLGVVRLVVVVVRRRLELAVPRRGLLGAFVARVLGHHAVHHRALSPWRALTLADTPPAWRWPPQPPPDDHVTPAERRLPPRPGPLAREMHRSCAPLFFPSMGTSDLFLGNYNNIIVFKIIFLPKK